MRPHRPARRGGRASSAGFTLLELLLATLISTLVVAMLATAMGLSLRLWEKRQGREAGGGLPTLADLAATQTSTLFHAEASGLTSGGFLLKGDRRNLVMLTATSLKAVTRGGPVIARYAYDEANKRLAYAEAPFTPNDLETMISFANADLSQVASVDDILWTDLEDFELFYMGEEGANESWEPQDAPPMALLARLAGKDGREFVRLTSPSSLDFKAKVKPWAPGAAR